VQHGHQPADHTALGSIPGVTSRTASLAGQQQLRCFAATGRGELGRAQGDPRVEGVDRGTCLACRGSQRGECNLIAHGQVNRRDPRDRCGDSGGHTVYHTAQMYDVKSNLSRSPEVLDPPTDPPHHLL
jgi:hypothetical protein